MRKRKCCRCEKRKPLKCFYAAAAGRSKTRTCSDCWSLKGKAYYNKNKEHVVARTSINKSVARQEAHYHVFRYLQVHPCVKCGIADPVVLDFDHLDPNIKQHNISEMIRRGQSWEVILAEIRKCQVLCANCHRQKTAVDQNWFKLGKNLPPLSLEESEKYK